MKEGVKIHVAPEYDIFNVFKNGTDELDGTAYNAIMEDIFIKPLPKEARKFMRQVMKDFLKYPKSNQNQIDSGDKIGQKLEGGV